MMMMMMMMMMMILLLLYDLDHRVNVIYIQHNTIYKGSELIYLA